MMDGASAPTEPSTQRILEAARHLVIRGGAAGISVGEVAALAAVSKALVLYHFRDKESLLLALVERMGDAVLARERAAMRTARPARALDDYWSWLDAELREGDLRALVALANTDSERVRTAARRIASERRGLAARHVGLIFAHLSLTPRMPAALLAETLTAFTDGLSVATALEPDRDPRPAFDAVWLALLTLSE